MIMTLPNATRADVVAVARSYVNTPFHARGRLPGQALDCAGVPICIARDLALVSIDFDVPPYIQAPDGVILLSWCRQHMKMIPRHKMRAGDVIVLKTDRYPQHIGILADYVYGGGFSIIHAANVATPPRVIETRLIFSEKQIYVASFILPGITD